MNQMQTGARTGKLNWLRRLAARATAQSLLAFVIPDPEMARRYGLDLEAAGLNVVVTPRHANVLLLVGEIPPGLAQAAAVVYSQMLRPRAVLTIGSKSLPLPLPAPDIQADFDLAHFSEAIRQLRQLFVEKAWSSENLADFAGPADKPEEAELSDDHSHMQHGPMPAMMSEAMPMEEMQHEGHAMNQTDMAEMQHEDHAPNMFEAEQSDHPMSQMDMGASSHDSHATMLSEVTQPDKTLHNIEHSNYSMPVKPPGPEPMEDMTHSDHAMGEMNIGEMKHDTHSMSDEMDMSGHDMGEMNMSGHDMGKTNHSDHAMSGINMDNHSMSGMNHSGHDMGGMDMGDHAMMMGGFMSMVAMTQDLPRSRDGLPMEWVEAPFGPLFPGLRAGLALTFTLDGEEVAQAKVIPGTLKRGLEESWLGPFASFPEKLARLDPLTPVSYRLLAYQALEQATGIKVDDVQINGRIGLLERERILSHLGWLAKLAELLGDNWLARHSARLQLDLVKAESLSEITRLRPALIKLKEPWLKTPLLKTRLAKKAWLNLKDLEGVTGPVARASGLNRDARLANPAYLRLGFKAQVQKDSDALARLLVRLDELEQSFDLIVAANPVAKLAEITLPKTFHEKVTSTAQLETPRGTATLSMSIERGEVSETRLDTSSAALVKLIGKVSERQDLADALIGVASLDLSPWELEP